MMRCMLENGSPSTRARSSRSRTRSRSSGCLWASTSDVVGTTSPGSKPWRRYVSGDHHQTSVARSTRNCPGVVPSPSETGCSAAGFSTDMGRLRRRSAGW
ncbi:Uncharacterised protein [Mycobacteroides abscessus]|nr:Uncharacterised protein [Mycobacteroides abscessus]